MSRAPTECSDSLVQCSQIILKNWKRPLFILLRTKRNSGLSLWAMINLSSPTSCLGLKLLTLAKACSNQDWLCRSCLSSKSASGFLAKDQSNGVLELSYLKAKTTKLIMVVYEKYGRECGSITLEL